MSTVLLKSKKSPRVSDYTFGHCARKTPGMVSTVNGTQQIKDDLLRHLFSIPVGGNIEFTRARDLPRDIDL